MIKLYCLHSIYNTAGVWLKKEDSILLPSAEVRFLKTVTLPLATFDTVGKGPDGKVKIQGQTVNKSYNGTPFLAEIVVLERAEENINLDELRSRLEARTESVAALLNFASHQIMGSFITSALFNRKDNYNPNVWDWEDIASFRTPLFHEELDLLKKQLRDIDAILDKFSEDKRDAINMAMRWLHRATQLETLIDRFIAYWIVLEIVSGQMGQESSIRLRIKETFKILYPYLDETGRSDSLCDVLYKARSKSLHGGFRDITKVHLFELIASTISEASLKYLTYQMLPPPLSDEILNKIGVTATITSDNNIVPEN